MRLLEPVMLNRSQMRANCNNPGQHYHFETTGVIEARRIFSKTIVRVLLEAETYQYVNMVIPFVAVSTSPESVLLGGSVTTFAHTTYLGILQNSTETWNGKMWAQEADECVWRYAQIEW